MKGERKASITGISLSLLVQRLNSPWHLICKVTLHPQTALVWILKFQRFLEYREAASRPNLM